MRLKLQQRLAALNPPPRHTPEARDCENPWCRGRACGGSAFCRRCQDKYEEMVSEMELDGAPDPDLSARLTISIDEARAAREAAGREDAGYDESFEGGRR
jgi:hypothetical protein